jgi:hypothetical protein
VLSGAVKHGVCFVCGVVVGSICTLWFLSYDLGSSRIEVATQSAFVRLAAGLERYKARCGVYPRNLTYLLKSRVSQPENCERSGAADLSDYEAAALLLPESPHLYGYEYRYTCGGPKDGECSAFSLEASFIGERGEKWTAFATRGGGEYERVRHGFWGTKRERLSYQK